MQSQIKF